MRDYLAQQWLYQSMVDLSRGLYMVVWAVVWAVVASERKMDRREDRADEEGIRSRRLPAIPVASTRPPPSVTTRRHPGFPASVHAAAGGGTGAVHPDDSLSAPEGRTGTARAYRSGQARPIVWPPRDRRCRSTLREDGFLS